MNLQIRKRRPRLALADRSVLITGAARGIGAETARLLHAKGARVSLVGLEPDLLAKLAGELGERVVWFEADVTDGAAMDAAAAGTVERFGGIDVVIANAGILPNQRTLLTSDPAIFRRVIDINLQGTYNTVAATLPHVVARRGHLLLVSSIYAFMNGAFAAAYAASKAGVEQLGRALRTELAVHDVTAGVAYFGFVDTEMIKEGVADAAGKELSRAFPSWILREIPASQVAEAVVAGIERRSGRVIAPGWVRFGLAMRGPLLWLDGAFRRHPRVRSALRIAEAADREGGNRAH